MGAVHHLGADSFRMAEVLQGLDHQHGLLKPTEHIVIGHDKQHGRIGFLQTHKVHRGGFVHDDPTAILAQLL